MKTLTPRNVITKVAEAGVFFTTFIPAAAIGAPGTEGGDCNAVSGSVADGAKCAQAPQSQPDNLFGPTGIFKTISNILIFLVGAVSVIMLIYGGLQYVISSGDSKRVESAKNTILYSIIGIVIAILAYAIVGFVTGSLTGSGNAGQ